MDRDAGLRAAADNVVGAFDLLGRHYGDPRRGRRRFGTVEALATGHDVPFFNPVVAFLPDANATDVLAGLEWIEGLGLAGSVHLATDAGPSVTAALVAGGLALEPEGATVMTLDLTGGGGAGRAVDSLTSVGDRSTVRAGRAELAEAWWSAMESTDRFRQTFTAALIGDPAVRVAVADLDGEPVAGAMAIRTGDILGVYVVYTQERARRRGLGRAATAAVIRAGAAAWGSTIATLESTAMGQSVYRSIGFRAVGSVVVYTRPRATGISPPGADPASPAATR